MQSAGVGRSRERGRLGASDLVASKDIMIQTTTRLSRGARRRRARPVWIYGVAVLAGVVLVGLGLLIFKS